MRAGEFFCWRGAGIYPVYLSLLGNLCSGLSIKKKKKYKCFSVDEFITKIISFLCYICPIVSSILFQLFAP